MFKYFIIQISNSLFLYMYSENTIIEKSYYDINKVLNLERSVFILYNDIVIKKNEIINKNNRNRKINISHKYRIKKLKI